MSHDSNAYTALAQVAEQRAREAQQLKSAGLSEREPIEEDPLLTNTSLVVAVLIVFAVIVLSELFPLGFGVPLP